MGLAAVADGASALGTVDEEVADQPFLMHSRLVAIAYVQGCSSCSEPACPEPVCPELVCLEPACLPNIVFAWAHALVRHASRDLPRPFLRLAADDAHELDPRSKFVRVRSVVKVDKRGDYDRILPVY